MKPDSLPILAILFSALFWATDAIIDTFIFDESESIFEAIFSPEPIELWMRVLVVILLISFSIYTRHLLNRQIKISNEIEKYKESLEDIVNLRTQELKDEIEVRKSAEIELEKIATTDPLTLLINRRKFSEIIKYEIERECRYRSGLSLIMCDIDKFKTINDNHGHHVGDEVLKTFSKVMLNSIRESDVIARWGGEEFIFLLPNTETCTVEILADKLRMIIENTDFKDAGNVTASFGVAFFEASDNEETLICRADKALYKAKGNGRNRVEVA